MQNLPILSNDHQKREKEVKILTTSPLYPNRAFAKTGNELTTKKADF